MVTAESISNCRKERGDSSKSVVVFGDTFLMLVYVSWNININRQVNKQKKKHASKRHQVNKQTKDTQVNMKLKVVMSTGD